MGRFLIFNIVLKSPYNYKEASKTVTLKEVNGLIIECSGAPFAK